MSITKMKENIRELKNVCGEIEGKRGAECFTLVKKTENEIEGEFGVDIEQDRKDRDVMDELDIDRIRV